jgi:hypothetical protein
VYASRAFYARLVEVPKWATLPLTIAAQAVQRSAFPNAYARWEAMASRLVGEIRGRVLGSVDCSLDDGLPLASQRSSYPPEGMGADGLTPRTRTAMLAVMAAFGVTDVGGFCPGGCTTGHIPGSDHYTGHAVDFMLLPMTSANRRLGDAIAGWLIANADRLAVKYVIWYERIWTRDRGWYVYRHPSGRGGATLAHRDHVHLSVL